MARERPNPAPWVLAGTRIYVGIVWLIYGTAKLNPSWATQGGEFEKTVRETIAHTSGPYHDFVTGVVLPNIIVFAHLIAWGETLCGIALTLGLLSRIGGVGGMFLAFNYWMAGGQYASKWGLTSVEAALFVLSFLTVALPTSNVASLDNLLARRFPVLRSLLV
jgi:uncharacterized membrane protein YphA (DoxX/SURF4 family)